MKKIDLVILCGGYGTRLKDITKKIPKPLIKIDNIPFIQYLINFYSTSPSIENIFLLTSYKSEKFFKIYHNKFANLKKITCLKEKKPLGTQGALFNLKKKVKNDFILTNGDSFVQFDLKKFLNLKGKNKMLLVKNRNYRENKKLIKLRLNNQKKIIYSNKKNFGLMNAGVYFFEKKILSDIKNIYSSLEINLLPKLIKCEKLFGLETKGYFIDIGTLKNLKKAKRDFKIIFKRPALFLDRDGVINYDQGYTHKKNKLKLITKNLKKIKEKYQNYYKFIITNQSGIGRGYYTEKQFLEFQKWMNEKIYLKFKILINDVKFCPHHPTKAKLNFKIKCKCRKPGNLSVIEILKNWQINKRKSIMIGDKPSDKKCAYKSGLRFMFEDEFI